MHNWLPAIATSSLLAVAVWLARNFILTRLTRSVAHDFDARLERLRGDLRESEERFKADLRAGEAKIAALQDGALGSLTERQTVLHRRRIEAVEQIWATVQILSPVKGIAATLAVLNLDKAADLAKRDARGRTLFDSVAPSFDIKKADFSSATKARPFLPKTVWATYTALNALVFHLAITWDLVKAGIIDREKFVSVDGINKMVAAALPESAESITKNGFHIYPFLLERLEEKLLEQLQAVLAGVEADKESVQQAGVILKLAAEAMKADEAARAGQSHAIPVLR